jgi:hypothetical protein
MAVPQYLQVAFTLLTTVHMDVTYITSLGCGSKYGLLILHIYRVSENVTAAVCSSTSYIHEREAEKKIHMPGITDTSIRTSLRLVCQTIDCLQLFPKGKINIVTCKWLALGSGSDDLGLLALLYNYDQL